MIMCNVKDETKLKLAPLCSSRENTLTKIIFLMDLATIMSTLAQTQAAHSPGLRDAVGHMHVHEPGVPHKSTKVSYATD